MHPSRRHLLALTVAAALGGGSLAGCSRATPQPGPSTSGSATPAGSASRASPSPTPAPLLTEPGVARRVVDELLATAGDHPVIKVDLTATNAQVSVLVDGSPVTWAWSEGTISEVTSDVEYVGQTSFNPSAFAFDDLGRLFGIAGALSGSLENQELQIVDHNEGDVLMTVTTRPESRPVFFRSDGSPIHELDFTTVSGLREGLVDVLGSRTQLAALGVDAQGMWADAPHPTDPGVMVRRLRPPQLPPFQSSRKEDAPEHLFSAVDVDPEVVARLVTDLPTRLGADPDTPVRWTVDMRHGLPEPTITVVVGGQEVVTDLLGLDITDALG